MKLDLNKFYNTNYKDFVHKEAVEEALKRVPELELKDVEVENILSLTFSVDQHGENPMYVEYLDKEGKKHIVRICPAVTEEINEILKNYETKEEHQADVENIYNYFNTLNVPMEVRSQNSLDEEGNKDIIMNSDNAFISFEVDPEQDNAIQLIAIQNINGGLGNQYQYMARFVDFAKVDEVPSNADFAEKLQELEEKMTTADNNVLATSKEYTDSNISSLANELNVKIEQTKNDLTVLIDEKAGDTLQQAKEYADSKDTEYFETSKRYADNVKQEAVDESKNYTNTKHDEALTIIEPCQQKLSNIWQSHKAPFIYWLPNIDVNTMKLENKENDVKVTLNDGDVVYWRKNAYQPTDLSEYATKRYAEDQNKVYGWNTAENQMVKCTGSFTVDHDGSSISRLTYRQTPDISVGSIVDFTNFATNEELLRQVTGLVEADTGNYSVLHNEIDKKTGVYTQKEGQSTETRYQRVTFNKLTNGDISFSPGISSDPIYGYLLNETQLTKLKNLNDNPTGGSPDIKFNNTEDVTKIDFIPGNPDRVIVTTTEGVRLNSAFITDAQANAITNNTTNINNLTQTVQELATKVGSSEIGERTPINFNLTNTLIGGTTNPTIISNNSYYVKVGNKNIVSVYLTFKVEVTPTSSQKMVTCGMEHDIPGRDRPYLTLTSTVKGQNNNYSNTVKVPTNQNFLQFYIPSIPATDTYNSMEIAIYGSAITKD